MKKYRCKEEETEKSKKVVVKGVKFSPCLPALPVNKKWDNPHPFEYFSLCILIFKSESYLFNDFQVQYMNGCDVM